MVTLTIPMESRTYYRIVGSLRATEEQLGELLNQLEQLAAFHGAELILDAEEAEDEEAEEGSDV